MDLLHLNGSFVKAKELLHDKASKAMYSLIQKGGRLNLPADSMLKLFRQLYRTNFTLWL